MAREIQLPTTQQLEKLYAEGNLTALQDFNERLSKVANQRMAQLYKSGIRSSSALERAKYYLYQESEFASGGVFSRSKKLSEDQIMEQLREELIFLRAPTSTVTGTKKIRALKSFATLTEGKRNNKGQLISKPYLEIPSEVKIPKSWKGTRNEYFQHKFLQFLSQDAWKDIKKYLYSTEDPTLLADAGEAIARGAKVSELNKAYKDYLAGEVDIFTMWESWTSIK